MLKNLSYEDRIEHCKHPLAQHLLQLMASKKTNLSLSADVTRKDELLALVAAVGSEICVLKTHIDIIEDFDLDLIAQLKKLAEKHQFLIFEDRKFADIGHTVQLQYQGGIYRIASWADLINAHTLPGPGIIAGLQTGLNAERGLLLLAEMSSNGNLLDSHYAAATLAMARQHKDFVMGFIAQHRLSDEQEFIYFTPGVGIADKADHLGQGYVHPTEAIKQGSDVIIVGRGIYRAPSPLEAAQQFRALGWQAYLQRCK